ncbi:MAG: HIRAN domain-containing protein [Pseudonocardia sp.]
MSIDEAAVGPVRNATDRAPTTWDAGRSPGSLIVAWQHPKNRLIAPVGLLEHGLDLGYRFRYLRRGPEVEGFLPFLSFPEWQQTYTSKHLFPLFSQRIMSPRRPDFSQFLHQLHLDENATPWEQLARSEGRRTGDTVQVFPIPAVQSDGSTTCRLLVHGIRHVTGGRLPTLDPGEELELRADPTNRINPDAVLVCTRGGEQLGYLPDLLLEHLHALQSAGSVTLTVEHVNGPEAPAHLRLLARLDGRAPTGYEPMSSPCWQTY